MVSEWKWSLTAVSHRVIWVCKPAHYFYARETRWRRAEQSKPTPVLRGALSLANETSNLTSLLSMVLSVGFAPTWNRLEDGRLIYSATTAWYSPWDLNPDFTVFETDASASWARRAWYFSSDSNRDLTDFKPVSSACWDREAWCVLKESHHSSPSHLFYDNCFTDSQRGQHTWRKAE